MEQRRFLDQHEGSRSIAGDENRSSWPWCY